MTTAEYNSNLRYYTCKLGKLGANITARLKLGLWCGDLESRFIEVNQLIKMYKSYDLRDLPDFTLVYNTLTETDMCNLMDLIKEKLG